MISTEPSNLINSGREVCYRCMRPKSVCFCETINSFNTNVSFKILMHPKEARKEPLGTGRMTHLALNNSEIIVDKTFDQNAKVQNILKSKEYYPMLLYPGPKSFNLSHQNITLDYFQGKIPVVFVLDGTWACAKSMMRDSKSLHEIPRLSFDPNIISKFDIKQQPQKFCLSTIESIYYLLSLLERDNIENIGNQKDELLRILSQIVNTQIEIAKTAHQSGSPRSYRPYKKPTERRYSERWLKRKVCFED